MAVSSSVSSAGKLELQEDYWSPNVGHCDAGRIKFREKSNNLIGMAFLVIF
jgi:hypothetical protein